MIGRSLMILQDWQYYVTHKASGTVKKDVSEYNATSTPASASGPGSALGSALPSQHDDAPKKQGKPKRKLRRVESKASASTDPVEESEQDEEEEEEEDEDASSEEEEEDDDDEEPSEKVKDKSGKAKGKKRKMTAKDAKKAKEKAKEEEAKKMTVPAMHNAARTMIQLCSTTVDSLEHLIDKVYKSKQGKTKVTKILQKKTRTMLADVKTIQSAWKDARRAHKVKKKLMKKVEDHKQTAPQLSLFHARFPRPPSAHPTRSGRRFANLEGRCCCFVLERRWQL
jgi:cellobiose-specific phosphotransferase system component IIA